MNSKYNDISGNTFITDNEIGFEDTSSPERTRLNRVNYDTIIKEAEKLQKNIFYTSNNTIEKINCDKNDIVVIEYSLGGRELFVKDCSENKDLVDMIGSLEQYPCLDDILYNKYCSEDLDNAIYNGTAYEIIVNSLSAEQNDIINEIEYSYSKYCELDSCSFYDKDMYKPNKIVDKRLLIDIISNTIKIDISEVDEYKLSDEHKKILDENIRTINSWHKEQQEKDAKPCQ